MLLQFTVIVLMSVVASYAFQHTETTYQINGICFHRYVVYAIAVFLSFICFAHYKKYIALAFSLVLSILAISPVGQKTIELFPSLVPFLAVLMGVATVLIDPSARGRGFLEFIVVLVLPAILAESRIGGSFHLLATTKSTGYYELSAIAVSIVGGYFYLKCATLANLSRIELLSNGGNERNVVKVTMWCNLITILVVISASGTAAILMATGPIAADVLRSTVIALPLHVLALALGAGISITTILYIFKLSHKEPH